MDIEKRLKVVKPDHLFEASWEVCNKVGGIHTVISTKALTISKELGGRYILIGPDLNTKEKNPEFKEDVKLLKEWRSELLKEGINVKIGRWRIPGSPIVVLVDFAPFFEERDQILEFMWDHYRVDSISGQWDYIEPVVFGYAAGRVIESYNRHLISPNDKVVAHFHEWMTGSGGLYLQQEAPNIATVFTTHATILGRSLAGNGEPLYSNLSQFNPDDFAHRYNITAKHSLEKSSAQQFDCFTTVSDITARESLHLLAKEVDVVTPNGFEYDFVWQGEEFDKKRAEARELMIRVAEACLDHKFEKEPLIVGTSGRYEFKNKGLDVLIESLKSVAQSDTLGREVLMYITVPAGNYGPRSDLMAHLADPKKNPIDREQYPYTTHYLSGWDPIVNAMANSVLTTTDSRVKVIFVPTYLHGDDGVFNKHYYELLVGMDATVYASYYEPWGYTPLESIAFSVPTITTSLAGFGLWVEGDLKRHKGVEVISRTDTNSGEVTDTIAKLIIHYSNMGSREFEEHRESALRVAKTALWSNMIEYYHKAYTIAIRAAALRLHRESVGVDIIDDGEELNFISQQLEERHPSWTRIMVVSNPPERLNALKELSNNLWWSWSMDAYQLFKYIDSDMWEMVKRNPIALLNEVSHGRLKELTADIQFLAKMDQIYAEFRAYMDEKKEARGAKIGYFCMEYGLHSSLKIYSGGLGILAGDYLKEASDKNVPLVAVGLLYRYGYFTQRLSAQGAQEASYEAQDFNRLPIAPVRDKNNRWLTIHLAFPGRTVTARIWRCMVGRTELYLLDTDHDLNLDEDRAITHHLYGGDWENRLKQELLLGIGGVRALEKMGIEQDIFHCNEGHASLMSVERIHRFMKNSSLSFIEAFEVVRSSSLFTTHTPVPAGHDAFPESMIKRYMGHYPERLGITWDKFISLGRSKLNDPNEKFSMSFLACNLSQEINGVSWLHGEVTKEVLGCMWPGYFKNELQVSYVTNGVHFPTWISRRLHDLYMKHFPEGFTKKEYDIEAWQKVHKINNKDLWEVRMHLKSRLVREIRKRMVDPEQMLFATPRQIVQAVDALKSDVLTIGFARRFATYKRADLLFTNIDRLDKIVNHPERPVQFIFAGKAHPNDQPGQDLIKRIVEVSSMPQFAGKLVFLQDYDMELARKMVQGVDVWLNTPTRPLEASGTSGQKCVMNGVLQFSVLDGWWVEGYKEGAGWMLPMEQVYTDNRYQNELDAEIIYTTIEEQIAPRYYDRDEKNLPIEWLNTIKRCIADIGSNFTTNRMFRDYENRFYHKLYERKEMMVANDFAASRELAQWKKRVSAAWSGVSVVSVERLDMSTGNMEVGGTYPMNVVVDINGLDPHEIGVEMVMANQIDDPHRVMVKNSEQFEFVGIKSGKASYQMDGNPKVIGSYDIAIRVYPKNAKLGHRMDLALTKWA